MPELALNILDLVQNSVAAGAHRIRIEIKVDRDSDRLILVIQDDGKGMNDAFLKRVESPFATSRTTRKVGLGIPLMKQEAEMTGGCIEITSEPGKGTTLTAVLTLSHIDRPPIGDLAGTMVALIGANPDSPEFLLSVQTPSGEFTLDTAEIRGAMGGLSLGDAEILEWIDGYAREGLTACALPD